MTAYAQLCQYELHRATLASAAGLLGWDERTYLPRAGQAFRGEQLALLSRLCHEQLIGPQTGDLLQKAESENYPPDSIEAANLRGIRRLYDRAVKIPPSLIEALARATSAGQHAWELAKTKNDFPAFLPHLTTILDLKRQEAQAVGYKDHPYDALLDEYEPGAKSAGLKTLFDSLQRQLVPLIADVAAAGKTPRRDILHRDYPIDRQRALADWAARTLGFSLDAGRIDVTVHPFCSGIAPGDVRITTRYNPNFFPESFFGALHEIGHGIYEQNLPADQFGLPCGTSCSLGIHESQSRMWENLVGRGRPFWACSWPLVQESFPESLIDVTLGDFYAAVNDVRPSLIRIEADEATYNLHIILRFELEQALLAGDLAAADLPAAWNDRFRDLLGLKVPDDSSGCLQDVHWSAGLFGYFPTYTLGNLYAAQFMDAARRDLPGLDDDFQRGDFSRLRMWLTSHIHRHGQRYAAEDLCRRATGQPLSIQPLMTHLRSKLAELYAL